MLSRVIIFTFLFNIIVVWGKTYNEFLHQKLATDCIFKFMNHSFAKEKLIVVLTEDFAETPGYEIENQVLGRIHDEHKWFLQVTDGAMHSFKSYKECKGTLCRVYFQENRRADYYLIITDDFGKLRAGLSNISKMRNFKKRAIFMVYYFKVSADPQKTADDVLMVLYNYSNYRAVAAIPTLQQSVVVYGLELFGTRNHCGEEPYVYKINECKDGSFENSDYSIKAEFYNLGNCSLEVIAMTMPPFVINQRDGLEIRILDVVKERLNVTFKYNVSDIASDWGSKDEGLLRLVYESAFNLGVGGVAQSEERGVDFDFSDDYFTERMVWIVPAALPIPQWQVITTIFTLSLWLVLLAILVTFGLFIFIASLVSPKEFNFLKMIGAGMVMSVQLNISSACKTQPKTISVRVLFICLALFNIIVSCCYQSSLIEVLTNTRYFPQLDTEEAVMESGLGIGGLKAYRNIFNLTNDPKAMKVYQMYEVYAQENDTMMLWLETVAKDRDTITVLGEYYVKYLQAKLTKQITNHDLTSKIYIVPRVLFSYSIRLIFSDGYPLQKSFNRIIAALKRAGLISKWRNDYLDFREKKSERPTLNDTLLEEDEEEEHKSSDGVTVITLEHMEGAFALVIMGNVAGTVFFILELLICCFTKSAFYRNVCKKWKNEKLRKSKKKEATKKIEKKKVKQISVTPKPLNVNKIEFRL